MKWDMGIDYYLTGFSGGVRYAPEDIPEAVDYLGLKEVDSGANVKLIKFVTWQESV